MDQWSILSDNIVFVKSKDSDIMNGIDIKSIDYREHKRMYRKMNKEGRESKQTDIDKILEIIKRKVLKGTHLPLMIKEIQAAYLSSLYFKDTYLYLAHNRLLSKRAAMKRVELLAEIYILLDSLLFKLTIIPGKETAFTGNP